MGCNNLLTDFHKLLDFRRENALCLPFSYRFFFLGGVGWKCVVLILAGVMYN